PDAPDAPEEATGAGGGKEGTLRPDRDPGEPDHVPVPGPAGAGLADAIARLRLRCGMEPRTLLALTVLLVVAVGFAVHHWSSSRPRPVPVAADSPLPADGTAPGADPAQASAPVEEELPLVVDVAGEVRSPGLHTLPPGSRVGDAIEAAGGLLPDADPGALNRARPIIDGEHIPVGAAGAPEDPPAPTGGGPGGAPHSPPGVAPDGRILLNLADAELLRELPGVGPVLAGNIVAHRERHGPFVSVEQLLDVSGIGQRRLEDVRDLVVIP
ncbi:ComEA family DNA-binding protein, partial [Streptomyces alkaliphilus]|uniref:ComEA family DNA-binding protein n=1 Tax=Streptomyces alkaliphilus TaxID=1472722 RepID=UPI0018889DAC